jgi:hypothetical protein
MLRLTQRRAGSFYESDCQGRTSSSLIGESFFRLQSAPAVQVAGQPGFLVCLAVFCGISYLASNPDPFGRSQATRSQTANHGSI